MDLREYLRVFRRRWVALAVCTGLALALTGALLARATATFTATTRLFVSTQQVDEGTAYQGGLLSQMRVASYADLIVGEQVAEAVVIRLGLAMSPGDVQEQLTSRVIPDTVIFEVTASDPSPAAAQDIADAAGEAFVTIVSELERAAPDAPPPIKVTIVDRADLPTEPTSPLPARSLTLAGLLGLLVGIAVALVREHLDVTVKNPDLLGDRLGAPVLGVIAYDSDAAKSLLPVTMRSQTAHAEAFRQLRTNLQFVDIDRDTRTLVVTSSLPTEGKTRTATNLALSLAQAGERVILVEADLRRPRVNQYLGLVDGVGVTTVLVGRADLADVLQPFGDLPFQFLACGQQPPNPSELLASDRMTVLLRDLREHADIVIIDAPPLLPVSDAAVLAREADGALLVVRHGRTSYEQVDQAAENLRLAGARLLGTVINMAPLKGQDTYAYTYAHQYTHTSEPTAGRRRSHRSIRRPPAESSTGSPTTEQIDDGTDRDLDRARH